MNKTIKGLPGRTARVVVIMITISIFFSCGNSKRKPAGILSKEEMVSVMSELLITEEKINRLGLATDSSKVVFQRIKDKMFAKTGHSDLVFRRSYNYYMDRPRELEEIYTALVDSLQLRGQRTQ